MKNTELEAILDRLSGLLDTLYECAVDEDEQDYINSVENELRTYLYQKGLLNNEAVETEKEESRKDIACDICPYYYKNEDEDSPRCHYEWDDKCAPCEIDDYEEEEEGWEDITCDTCPHYYEDEDEDGPRCHCKSTDGSEPCEIKDYFYGEEEND